MWTAFVLLYGGGTPPPPPPVPEPTTVLLLGIGLIALGLYGGRKRG